VIDAFPAATPRFIAIAAPNSIDASMLTTFAVSSTKAKNPPPPNNDTVNKNGWSRSQNAKRNVASPPINGR